MDTEDPTQIRIQILAPKEETGAPGRMITVARKRIRDLAEIARAQGAEALLVCPAPDEHESDGIELVVAARFGQELEEDAVFWRQRSLAREIYHALRVEALVLDLDGPLDAFLNHIEPMLASAYRDQIGRRPH
jgi:hypothetical protein